jgi:uncharacterized membrane protein YdjX (TVP38/TMEM64 family)
VTIDAVVEWLRDAGAWQGPLCFALFVAANLAFVPNALLAPAAGFVCGFPLGLATVLLARPTAAVLAYGLARSLFREAAARAAARVARFEALDRALAAGGFKVVLLLRLSPMLPSTISNYVLGATAVRFRDYALGSALGTIPTSTLYTYLGSSALRSGQLWQGESDTGPAGEVLFFAGLLATALLVWLLARGARRELQRVIAAAEAAGNSTRSM